MKVIDLNQYEDIWRKKVEELEELLRNMKPEKADPEV